MSKFEQVVTELGLDASYISSNHTLNMPNRLNYVTTAIPLSTVYAFLHSISPCIMTTRSYKYVEAIVRG